MSVPAVKNTDITFNFVRENPFDETVKIKAFYTGPANIYRDNILLKTMTIPESYHPTDAAKCRCFLALTSSLVIVGPLMILMGSINSSPAQLVSGVCMSAFFVISCIFSCNGMHKSADGFQKYQIDIMNELLPEAKEEALQRIEGVRKPIVIQHEVKLGDPNKHFSEKNALLAV